MENEKLMRYNKIDILMCRDDMNGKRKPVNIKYCTLDGEVIKADNVVCTSVDHIKTSRRVRFCNTAEGQGDRNAMTRTLCDCLILNVDDYKIVVS